MIIKTEIDLDSLWVDEGEPLTIALRRAIQSELEREVRKLVKAELENKQKELKAMAKRAVADMVKS